MRYKKVANSFSLPLSANSFIKYVFITICFTTRVKQKTPTVLMEEVLVKGFSRFPDIILKPLSVVYYNLFQKVINNTPNVQTSLQITK